MKKILNIFALCAATFCVAALTGCNETLEYIKKESLPPVITSFSPATAIVGGQISVKGENLERITAATIGGLPVEIKSYVGTGEVIILASATGQDGTIVLTNSAGTGESESSFAYNYVRPTVNASQLPGSVELNTELTITGTNMNVANFVYFVVAGKDPAKATILTQNKREIVIKVPYVPGDDATLEFGYVSGPGSTTMTTDGTQMEIVRNAPAFDPVTFGEKEIGYKVNLTGVNLQKIDSILVGGVKAPLSNKTATTLTFTVPTGTFAEGVTTGQDVFAYCFEGNEEQDLGAMDVMVPRGALHWRDIFLGSTDPANRAGFFSYELGETIDNSKFATDIDPVAAQYTMGKSAAGASGGPWTGLACSKPNVPLVSETAYNSVKPYFFMTAMSGRGLAISSPGTSSSQPRNYRMNGVSSQRVPLGTNAEYDCCGSVVVMHRLLYPGDLTNRAAEDRVINIVKADTLTVINQGTFPIDVTNNTIAGIKLLGTGNLPSGALRSQENTTGSGLTPTSGTAIWGTASIGSTLVVPYNSDDNVLDAVIMSIYYDYRGYDATKPASNIKKIGFMYIKRLTLRDGASAETPAKSNITFDMYWQKYANNPILAQ